MKVTEKYRAQAGGWALVTGAAGGIGLALADRLAALGYGLMLVDIDSARLESAATNLATHHSVGVRSLRLDLSKADAAVRLHDLCTAQHIDPVIVINSTGVFIYNDLVATDPARIELILGLHVTTVTMICRLFGADMARHRAQNIALGAQKSPSAGPKLRAGWILNISSYSAWMPWPGLALYCASKSYIRMFSLSLAAELREQNISVTTVLPAAVTTSIYGLSQRLLDLGRRTGLNFTPERMAELALAAMFRGRRQYIPGLAMRLSLPIVRAFPAWAVRILRRATLRFQK